MDRTGSCEDHNARRCLRDRSDLGDADDGLHDAKDIRSNLMGSPGHYQDRYLGVYLPGRCLCRLASEFLAAVLASGYTPDPVWRLLCLRALDGTLVSY